MIVDDNFSSLNLAKHQSQLAENGFSITPALYTEAELDEISSCINHANSDSDAFRKSNDLFAIRRFLTEVPDCISLIFNDKLKAFIQQMFGDKCFVVKSIYFDKPESSNWYVPYHQDLMISVNDKIDLEGFGPWSAKNKPIAVQPPVELLESIFTIRIHLDETTKDNGALKVVPKSHLKKIYRPETIDWNHETEVTCEVEKGGLMLMKPLLLHSSGRSNNQKRRRVIHIEFSDKDLPEGLMWAERYAFAH